MALFYAIIAVEGPDRTSVERRVRQAIGEVGRLDRVQSKASYDLTQSELDAVVRTQRRAQ